MLSHQELTYRITTGKTFDKGRDTDNFNHFFARRKSLEYEVYIIKIQHAISETEEIKDWLKLDYNAQGFIQQDKKLCFAVVPRTDYVPMQWAYYIFKIVSQKATLDTNYCIHISLTEGEKYIYIQKNINHMCPQISSEVQITNCGDYQVIVCEHKLEELEKRLLNPTLLSQDSQINNRRFKRFFEGRHKSKRINNDKDLIYEKLIEVYNSILCKHSNEHRPIKKTEDVLVITGETDIDVIQKTENIIHDIKLLNDRIPDADIISQKLYMLEDIIVRTKDNNKSERLNRILTKYIPACIKLVEQYSEMSYRDKVKNAQRTAEMLQNAIFAIKYENESEEMWKQIDYESSVKAISSMLFIGRSIDEQLSEPRVTSSILENIEKCDVIINGYDDSNIICSVPGKRNVSIYLDIRVHEAHISVDEKMLKTEDLYNTEYEPYIRLANNILKEMPIHQLSQSKHAAHDSFVHLFEQ